MLLPDHPPEKILEILLSFLESDTFDSRIITLCCDAFIAQGKYNLVIQIAGALIKHERIAWFEFTNVVHKLVVQAQYKSAKVLLMIQPRHSVDTQRVWEDYI